MPKLFSRKSNFTLLELMVVLLITSLVLAIALPRLGELPHGIKIKNSKSTVVNAFKMASMRAMASGGTATITIDRSKKNNHKLTISCQVPKIPREASEQLDENGEPVQAELEEAQPTKRYSYLFEEENFEFPNGVTIQENEALNDPKFAEGTKLKFVIYPDGEAYSTGNLTMKIKIDSQVMTIDIDRLTGVPLIKVEDEE